MTPLHAGKLLVLGNLGSGKSTLARALEDLTGWPVAGIDDARRRLGDGTPAGEARAWAHFLARVEERRPTMLECTGGGPFIHLLRLALRRSGLPWAVLRVHTPAEECLGRLRIRGLDVPYPDFGIPLEEVVPRVERDLDRLMGTVWPAPLCTVNGMDDPTASAARAAEAVLGWLSRERTG